MGRGRALLRRRRRVLPPWALLRPRFAHVRRVSALRTRAARDVPAERGAERSSERVANSVADRVADHGTQRATEPGSNTRAERVAQRVSEHVSDGVANVRFHRIVRQGPQVTESDWIATVAYAYTKAPMGEADRLRNPLGFQVTSYRADPEVVR